MNSKEQLPEDRDQLSSPNRYISAVFWIWHQLVLRLVYKGDRVRMNVRQAATDVIEENKRLRAEIQKLLVDQEGQE